MFGFTARKYLHGRLFGCQRSTEFLCLYLVLLNLPLKALQNHSSREKNLSFPVHTLKVLLTSSYLSLFLHRCLLHKRCVCFFLFDFNQFNWRSEPSSHPVLFKPSNCEEVKKSQETNRKKVLKIFAGEKRIQLD